MSRLSLAGGVIALLILSTSLANAQSRDFCFAFPNNFADDLSSHDHYNSSSDDNPARGLKVLVLRTCSICGHHTSMTTC